MSEKMGQIESAEIKSRYIVTPKDVENVWKSQKKARDITDANNVLKVLDYPDNVEEKFRAILLQEKPEILKELAKKSKQEILNFLNKAKEKQTIKIESEESKKLDIENQKNEEKFSKIDSLNNQENQKLNQDIQKIKSVFTPQILEQNDTLSDLFQNLDNKSVEQKDKALKDILEALKNDNGKLLKSITEQLWWADKNNPKYLEFKNTLVWLDSWFDKYFQDLEKISSWNSLNASEVISWIEKDSWWMIDIDLNSNIPTSKLSLIWSHYSFDEEIDKQVLEKITLENKDKLDELQSSFATLKGVYTPFDWLLKNIKANWWKENLKEKINESISNFSRNLFSELDEVYEKNGIKSDIQIKEQDISSFTDIKSENDLKQKIDNFKNKIEKIKAQLVETQNEIINKYQTQIKESLTLKSKEKEKQVEVLNFMRDSGFDLIPKEISDKFIQQLQANTLNIPWLDLDTKNINLKNGNFWESVLYKDDGLNIHSKTNMLKFMNKMISWDTNQPLKVESIANGSENINPNFLQNKFLENWIVDNLGWKEWKISENLSKWNNESIKS